MCLNSSMSVTVQQETEGMEHAGGSAGRSGLVARELGLPPN